MTGVLQEEPSGVEESSLGKELAVRLKGLSSSPSIHIKTNKQRDGRHALVITALLQGGRGRDR